MAEWIADGLDSGWLTAAGIGAIRSPRSYRPGGWWFLPDWLPDQPEHDVGPFPTRTAAITFAEIAAGNAHRVQ